MNRWISGEWNQAWETQYGFENVTGLCGFPIKVNAAYFTSDPKQMGAKYRSKNPVFLYVYTRWFTDAKSEKLRPRMFPSNANSEYISRFDDGALFSASLSRRYKELLYWFRRAARPTIYFLDGNCRKPLFSIEKYYSFQRIIVLKAQNSFCKHENGTHSFQMHICILRRPACLARLLTL